MILSVVLPFVASAQVDREVKKSVKIYFRQGSSTIDDDYMNNGATLRDFAAEVKVYYEDAEAYFRQVRILSSASPEGGAKVNDRLAKQRAEAIMQWISREIAVDLEYAVESTGIDWELLRTLILENEDVPYRDEVLKLLDTVPVVVVENGKEVEVRYNQLKALRAGEPYRWIYVNLFPELRYASARCEFWWETIPELLVTSESPIRVPADGGAGVITFDKSVADNVIPTVQPADEWVDSLVPTASDVVFTVAPNPSSEPRTSSVIMSCYGKQYEVPVEQEGATPDMHLTSAGTVCYAAEGAEDEITFEKRVDDGVVPAVKSSADWIDSIVPTDKGITYIVKENTTEEPRTATITVESYGEEHVVTVNQLGAEPKCKPFYMSIKTNMLYDLAMVPNIGAEFYLGKNFSIAANWHYSWWKKDKTAWYWRTYGGDASVRYWLGKESRIKPLTGHHLGVYGQMITYDFEVGNKGVLADKWSWAVGVEYGYSLPITQRLNIDFTLGFGYHWGLFDEYLPIDGHYVWQATKRRRYVGPTKLEISLEWLIGCGNYNKDKKGRR